MKEIGFTKHRVIQMLNARGLEWSEFAEWIRGQTCPVDANGVVRYYSHDVDRFFRIKFGGE